MSTETYINHPNFGLLYQICQIQENQELFTTLYAQRLFFVVTYNGNKVNFESVGRSDARLLVENRLRHLRRLGLNQEYQTLMVIHKRTF